MLGQDNGELGAQRPVWLEREVVVVGQDELVVGNDTFSGHAAGRSAV